MRWYPWKKKLTLDKLSKNPVKYSGNAFTTSNWHLIKINRNNYISISKNSVESPNLLYNFTGSRAGQIAHDEVHADSFTKFFEFVQFILKSTSSESLKNDGGGAFEFLHAFFDLLENVPQWTESQLIDWWWCCGHSLPIKLKLIVHNHFKIQFPKICYQIRE